MRLALKYRGDGLTVKGTPEEKHRLRREFHRQILRLWNSDNRLKTIDRAKIGSCVKNGQFQFDVQRTQAGTIPFDADNPLSAFMFRHTVRGVTSVPLVTEPMGAECLLEIRMGRPVRPGKIIFAGGDFDNRLKTLFDALRMPHSSGELPDGCPAEEIMCLLADDSLITEMSVKPYELLDDVPNGHYVDLHVDVTIRAVVPMSGTAALLW